MNSHQSLPAPRPSSTSSWRRRSTPSWRRAPWCRSTIPHSFSLTLVQGPWIQVVGCRGGSAVGDLSWTGIGTTTLVTLVGLGGSSETNTPRPNTPTLRPNTPTPRPNTPTPRQNAPRYEPVQGHFHGSVGSKQSPVFTLASGASRHLSPPPFQSVSNQMVKDWLHA